MYPVLSNNMLLKQRNLIDTLFGEDFFSPPTSAVIDDYSVRTNVSTTDEEYRIDVVAPGLDKSDMNVKVEGNQLYVSEGGTNVLIDSDDFNLSSWIFIILLIVLEIC